MTLFLDDPVESAYERKNPVPLDWFVPLLRSDATSLGAGDVDVDDSTMGCWPNPRLRRFALFDTEEEEAFDHPELGGFDRE